LGGTAPVHAAPPCAAREAHYAQPGRDGFRAQFMPAGRFGGVGSDLFFVVRSRTQAYWFRFTVAHGYGGVGLEAIENPENADEDGPRPIPGDEDDFARGLPFLAYRADMSVLDNPPMAATRAPRVLILPTLPLALWYAPNSIGGTEGRVGMSMSGFVLKGCGPARRS
jgi:hypothetical protein